MALKTITRGWLAIDKRKRSTPPAVLTDVYLIGLDKKDDGRGFFTCAEL